MALYYVTGQAGTGKTTQCEIFKSMGFQALDGDEDALSRWMNTETGYIHPKSSVKETDRTDEFLAVHDWIIPVDTVAKLADKAKDTPLFLFGVSGNEQELRSYFAHVCALYLNPTETEQRLLTRSGNSWGKKANEMAFTLSLLEPALKNYQDYGYTLINADQSSQKVTQFILEATVGTQLI